MNDQVNRPQGSSEWLKRYRNEFSHDPDFVAEGLAIRFTSEIARMMVEQGVSRSSLAETLGVSRAYVTKIMNAPPNLTLRSLVSVAMPLDADVVVNVVPRGSNPVRVPINNIDPPVAATAADNHVPANVVPLRFPTAVQLRPDELPTSDALQLAIA